uniref:SCAN box domain-containing protein n=1 Tax=Latimeria chalumnae TaxID=7897 RepID=H3ADP8_LATCH
IWTSHVLQKMTPKNDVEARRYAFEREAWPRAQWASIIASFLVEDAQKAYFNLEPEATSDYTQLKAKILTRAGVTTIVRAQCLHAWRFQEGKVPRSQMFDFVHLARRWLQLDTNNPAQVIEILVMGHFLRGLPPMVRKWVGQGNLANTQELIDLVGRQLTMEELARTPFIAGVWNSEHPLSLKDGTSSGTGKTVLGKGGAKEWSDRGLKSCNELGHITVCCLNEPGPMECVNVVNSVEGTHQFMKPIKVNGKESMALTDIGSAMTLISVTLVKPSELDHTQKTGITCVHRDVDYYLTARV